MEILLNVFTHLDLPDLIAVAGCCSAWRRAAVHDDVWVGHVARFSTLYAVDIPE